MRNVFKVLNILSYLLVLFFGSGLHAKTTPTVEKPTTKTVLITGGLGGIGKEITLKFRDAGWDVWATSRHPAKHQTITGINVRRLEDVTNANDIKALIQEIKTTSGRLEVLVNNAGYGVLGPAETLSVEQARKILDVNVIGPLEFIQAVLPIMRTQKSGHIINISSTSGLRSLPGLAMYGASKQALEGLSEGIAAEISQWNIYVSIVEPGTIDNRWVHNALLADNLKEYPGYSKFTQSLRTSLSKKAKENGQKPAEVADLVFEIANNPKPDLRYQTNATVSALAHEILIDPTGNKMRDKAISFSREMYQAY